jgi:hypothetical protein
LFLGDPNADELPVEGSHGLWHTMAAVTNLFTVSVSKALGNKDETELGEGISGLLAIL